MENILIWLGSTLFVSFIGFLLAVLKDYNEVLAGFVALILCILVLVFIVPMAF